MRKRLVWTHHFGAGGWRSCLRLGRAWCREGTASVLSIVSPLLSQVCASFMGSVGVLLHRKTSLFLVRAMAVKHVIEADDDVDEGIEHELVILAGCIGPVSCGT